MACILQSVLQMVGVCCQQLPIKRVTVSPPSMPSQTEPNLCMCLVLLQWLAWEVAMRQLLPPAHEADTKGASTDSSELLQPQQPAAL